MAGGAAGGRKGFQAALLLFIQGTGVARGKSIIGAAGRDQGALIGGDRFCDGVSVYGLCAKCTFEQRFVCGHRRNTRSEEHTSELQSLMRISYAVFCLNKKNNKITQSITTTHHETQRT